MIDFSTTTDADLDAQRIAVLTEQEHRQIEATYPAQIERLSERYAAATGRRTPPVEAAERGALRGKPVKEPPVTAS